LIVLAPDFTTKICKKAAQDFHRAVSRVFDRVKSVALWSANIRKLAKDHKGYGSSASVLPHIVFLFCFLSWITNNIIMCNCLILSIKSYTSVAHTRHDNNCTCMIKKVFSLLFILKDRNILMHSVVLCRCKLKSRENSHYRNFIHDGLFFITPLVFSNVCSKSIRLNIKRFPTIQFLWRHEWSSGSGNFHETLIYI
jgi:hypothetical protein